MTLVSELKTILEGLSISVETGVFSSTPPARYAVLTPLTDTYAVYADNTPEQDIQEIRISLFDKGNYLAVKKQIETSLMSADITITARRYISHDDGTGYHQYVIDAAKNYNVQEET